MISSSSALLKSYAFGSLHIKVNLYILEILGATLLKWGLNLQHLKKSNFNFPFSGDNSVVVDSLFIVVAPIVFCVFLALLCSIRCRF